MVVQGFFFLLCPRRRRSTRPPRGAASKRSGEGREIESWEARLEQWARARQVRRPAVCCRGVHACWSLLSGCWGSRSIGPIGPRRPTASTASAHLRQRERRSGWSGSPRFSSSCFWLSLGSSSSSSDALVSRWHVSDICSTSADYFVLIRRPHSAVSRGPSLRALTAAGHRGRRQAPSIRRWSTAVCDLT